MAALIYKAWNVKLPSIEDMSPRLSEAWGKILLKAITRSFICCLLGDYLYVHIENHELYGIPFRIKIAEIATLISSTDFVDDVPEEENVTDIDDL